MEKIVGIYKITNPSGKVYVGQSVNLNSRIGRYRKLNNCKNQKALYNSFLKHSVEAHIFEITEECSAEQLNQRERFWQDFYDSVKSGLNCRATGFGDKSGYLSQETKGKLSESAKGRKGANLGKTFSDETRQRMRDSRPDYKKSNHPRAKRIINTKTGEVFNCLADAADSVSIHRKTLTKYLTGVLKNKTDLDYEFKSN